MLQVLLKPFLIFQPKKERILKLAFAWIAYAASIGGMSTLVGTAPNIIFVGFIQETYGIEISFIDWMKLGVPLAFLCLLPHGMQLQKLFTR